MPTIKGGITFGKKASKEDREKLLSSLDLKLRQAGSKKEELAKLQPKKVKKVVKKVKKLFKKKKVEEE